MALIKCPECGREVSDTAKSCPNCGYSMKGIELEKQKVDLEIFGRKCCKFNPNILWEIPLSIALIFAFIFFSEKIFSFIFWYWWLVIVVLLVAILIKCKK